MMVVGSEVKLVGCLTTCCRTMEAVPPTAGSGESERESNTSEIFFETERERERERGVPAVGIVEYSEYP